LLVVPTHSHFTQTTNRRLLNSVSTFTIHSPVPDMPDNQQALASNPKSIDSSSCQACDGTFSNEVGVPCQPGHLETALLRLDQLPAAELEKCGSVCPLQESCVCSPSKVHHPSKGSRTGSEKASSERVLCTDGKGNEPRCQKRRSKRRLLGDKRAASENALVVDDKAETNRIDTTQYVRRSDSNLVGSSTEQKEGSVNGGCVVVKDRRIMLRRSRNTRYSSPRRQLLKKSLSKRKSKRSLKDPTNSAFNDSIHSNADDAKDTNEPSDRSLVRRLSMPLHTVTSLVNPPDLNSIEHKPPSDEVHEGCEMDSLSNLLVQSCSTDNVRRQVAPVHQRRHSAYLQIVAPERSLFLSHENGSHSNTLFDDAVARSDSRAKGEVFKEILAATGKYRHDNTSTRVVDKNGRKTRSCAMAKQQLFMGCCNLGSSTSTTQWDL
jgi:hypothetical protein